jgi:hypothetical protein
VSPHSDESPERARESQPPERLPELADPVRAGDQSAGEQAADLLPVPFDQARDALRSPRAEEVIAAASNLVRGETVREVVRALLAEYSERYREAVDRADDLNERLLREQRECLERLARERLECQEKLAREQQDHAVTKTNLTHAGTRTAGQILLQILGGGFFGWGVSAIDKSWAGLAYIVIALVMIGIGSLPILTIPWWRGRDG